MKLTYDPRYNVAYLRLRPRRTGVATIELGDDLAVDLAPDGTVYGIEFLNANEQLARRDEGKLRVVNEATGEEHEVRIRAGRARARKRLGPPRARS